MPKPFRCDDPDFLSLARSWVLHRPGDDLSRLVLADWLAEHSRTVAARQAEVRLRLPGHLAVGGPVEPGAFVAEGRRGLVVWKAPDRKVEVELFVLDEPPACGRCGRSGVRVRHEGGAWQCPTCDREVEWPDHYGAGALPGV